MSTVPLFNQWLRTLFCLSCKQPFSLCSTCFLSECAGGLTKYKMRNGEKIWLLAPFLWKLSFTFSFSQKLEKGNNCYAGYRRLGNPLLSD